MKSLALFISAALLFGPIPQSGLTSQSAQIDGTVLRADGSTPLAGVRILLRKDQSVRSESDYGTMSGSNGHFVIKGIEPGRYRLLAKQTGFIDAQYGQTRPNRPGSVLDLSKGEAQSDLSIRMTAGAVVSGRVYDDQGRALSGVEVQLIQPRYQSNGHITPVMISTATTDDRGEYRAYWVGPGNYYATATVFQRSPLSDTALSEQFDGTEQVMLPTFYPNAFDDAHATPIRVEAGTELRGIDFTLTRLRGVRVRGQIVDGATGAAVPGARVLVQLKTEGWANLSPTTSVLSDINGEFELRRVAPGTNAVTVSMTLPGPRPASSRLEVQIGDRDVSGLQLVLQPTPSITGKVVFEGQRREGSLRFTGVDGSIGSFTGVNPDGNFTMLSPGPNIYRVSLSFPENFFIRSARSGYRDVLRDGVDVTAGTPEPLEIRIASTAGTVHGVVTDENNKAVVGAQVVLIPNADRRERTDLFKNTPTDQLGQFTIRGVAPGGYKLFAWVDLDPGAYFDPEFIRQYEAQGSPVQVDEDGNATTNLKAIP